MKTLFGVSLLLIAQVPLVAVEVGNTLEQVQIEKGLPPGKMVAGGVTILAYGDVTIRLQNGRVIKIGGPPRQVSIVPAPKPKPKPKPVPVWIDDVDTALTQAQERKRHVLLFFTGEGWGPRGQHLESDVLSSEEFVNYANDNLVLVKMNFPKAATSLPKEGTVDAPAPTSATTPSSAVRPTKENKGDDYPMVFVLDSDGRPSGSLGYQDGGPGPFIDALKKL